MRKIIPTMILWLFMVTINSNAQNILLAKKHVELELEKMRSHLKKDDLSNALLVIKNTLSFYEKQIQQPDSLLSELVHYLGESYLDSGDYNLAKEQFDRCLEIRRRIMGDSSIHVARAYNSIGLYFDYSNNIEEAIKYYEKAMALYNNNLPDSQNDLGVTYANLGICYAILNDYSKAILFCNKALDIDINVYGPNHTNVGIDLFNIGLLYKQTGNNDKARQYYQQGREILIKNGKGKSLTMAQLVHNIGTTFESENNYPEAIAHLEQALEIRQNILEANDFEIIKNEWVIGWVYLQWKKYPEAMEHLQGALRLAQSNDLTPWERYEDIYQLLGKCHLALGELDLAQDFFQKAKAVVFDNTLQMEQSQNGRKLNIWSDLLVLEADVYRARYSQSGKVDLLKRAQEGYLQSLALRARARQELTGNQSKVSWLDLQYANFEKAMDCNFQLAQISDDPGYKHQAFDWAEQSRALILLDALQETKAQYFAGIPPALLQKEQRLQERIAEKEQEIFYTESDTDSMAISLKGALFDLHLSLDSLVLQMEKNYPEYYRLKYENRTVTIDDLQKEMEKGQQGILQYFVGDSSIFIFVIGSDFFEMEQIALDFPLEEWVADWRRSIDAYGSGTGDTKAIEVYTDLALQLYQKLIAPVADRLPLRLTIIADGILAYLPFDALLRTAPIEAGRFRQYDYLLHHHQVSYAFSSTWWKDCQSRDWPTNVKSEVLAVAPSFGDRNIAWAERSAGLGALRFNQEEARSIVDIWGGRLLEAQSATEDRFKALAGQYQILHLATHAKANDQIGDYSYLAFTEVADSLENELLYARELYELPLQADLVVLSACETGIGELQKGEGIISLARGFSYAGAKSILTTLWRVSDDKARQLMVGFYKKLKQQGRKDEALQQSKLDYLTQCRDREAHPFYWAAFVPIGNMEVLERPVYWYGWVGLLVILILIGGGGYWWRNKF